MQNRPTGEILSTPDDVERLEVAVAAPYDGLAVVGSFRSHLRDGLNLDDRDLTVCQLVLGPASFSWSSNIA